MRVKKNNPAPPPEMKLKLQDARFVLYNADAASNPPNHPRVVVTIPGKSETGEDVSLSQDMPLSEVLDKKKIAALEPFRDAFVQALLVKQGLELQADDLAEE